MSKYVAKLVPSEILGERYRIVSLLGLGGMGAVYLAEDLKLQGKRWAIKETIKSVDDMQQFIDEAEILMKLDHPHLPNIVDYFPPDGDGYSYLVMDYIQGKTLMQCFEEESGFFDVQRLLRYCKQICDLFVYLHGHQPKAIIYRDLKPSNVMIDLQDQVRLIDFGVARNYKYGQHSDTIPLGTIGFAAPEQFEQLQTDHRTDLYNLGAMMYYLLSGGHYYYMSQKSLSEHRSDLPSGLICLIERLLLENPDERVQSAFEVKQELENLMKNEQPSDSTQSMVSSIQSRVIVVGSLYPGAGSTFVSMALARMMHHCKMENAVIEFLSVEPELYSLLYGEKVAPKGYQFLMERLDSRDKINGKNEWKDGFTTWYPLHPHSDKKLTLNEQNSYKMLFTIKQPMMIIDISDHWLDPSVQQLCQEADEILVVADAFPHKWNLDSSQQKLAYAYELKVRGKSVHFIANKETNLPIHKEWIRSFPWRPICRLPYIPIENFVYSIWKGEIIQDQRDIFPKLWDALYPFFYRIMPDEILKCHKKKKNNLLIKLKNTLSSK